MKKVAVRRALRVALFVALSVVVVKVLADWPVCNPQTGECIP